MIRKLSTNSDEPQFCYLYSNGVVCSRMALFVLQWRPTFPLQIEPAKKGRKPMQHNDNNYRNLIVNLTLLLYTYYYNYPLLFIPT
jgi:hypothetical protein